MALIFLVTFDIHDDVTRLTVDALLEHLYDDQCRIQQSVWLIKTDKDTAAVKSDIKEHIDPEEDRLFVTVIDTRAGAVNLENAGIVWLKKNGIEVV